MKGRTGEATRAWQLLMRVFYAQRGQRPPADQDVGLSPVQCHVLHLIEPDRPVAMRRLADALRCDASNVTGLVDRLEARGLVRRESAPNDRRVKVLALTPAGARLRAQLLDHTAHRSHPLSRLSPDEQRTLVALLERLLTDEE